MSPSLDAMISSLVRGLCFGWRTVAEMAEPDRCARVHRDRLETVEQKVFAIELRLQAQEHRQSLPGMPPTPSRAIGTPGRGLIPTANIQTPSKGVTTPARVPLSNCQ